MVGSQLADGQAHLVVCETCLKATVIPAALLPKGYHLPLHGRCRSMGYTKRVASDLLLLFCLFVFSLPEILLGLAHSALCEASYMS